MPSTPDDRSDAFFISPELEDTDAPYDPLTATKADLAQSLHDALAIPKVEAVQVIDAFFDTLQKTLGRGEEVKLMHFGSFELRNKEARPGRNPRTGEPVTITPRRVVTFHATPQLKRRLQERYASELELEPEELEPEQKPEKKAPRKKQKATK
jgi:integration host factor subunit alpha